MSTPETLTACPDCGQSGFTQRGLKSHFQNARCRKTSGENRALAQTPESLRPPSPYPARTVTLETLDVMPATPQAARTLKEMSLPELEAADRALRAMPERLEKLSGITAVLNGLVLAEIKAKLEHKQFTPWLLANYGKSKRTAQVYMQLGKAFTEQKRNGCAFDDTQLTLALLDATAEQSLDLAHPVVQAVEKWADGRSYKRLIEEEIGDGRANNPGGFRPNAAALFSWLKEQYPDNPEYLDLLFDELPPEVQARFRAEGERYSERLPKAVREEIEREMSGREWMHGAAKSLTEAHDAHPYHYGSTEELAALETALADFLADVRKHLRERAEKRPAKQLARS